VLRRVIESQKRSAPIPGVVRGHARREAAVDQLVRHHGGGEEISLRERTVERPEHGQLALVLDSFGDHGQPRLVATTRSETSVKTRSNAAAGRLGVTPGLGEARSRGVRPICIGPSDP
jgi:hypothetical protein